MPKKGTTSPFKGIPRKDWTKHMQPDDASEDHPASISDISEISSAAALMNATGKIHVPKQKPSVSARPEAPPPNLFSGDIKKLEVFGKDGNNMNPIPGYRLYWFLDADNSGTRLQQAKLSGYEFVHYDEVSLNDQTVNPNLDLGSNVKVIAGSANGAPTFHYLMKKPQWLHDLHQSEMQKIPDRIEAELRGGTLNKQAGDGRFTKRDMPTSTLPEIDISSSLARSTNG